MATEEYRCKTRIEVQFRDLDALGHVNNAVYFSYFETARMAYLRAVSGKPVRLGDLRIVLVDAACRYRSPAMLGEVLEIGIRVSHLRRSSFAFEYSLRCVTNVRLVAVGRTVQATFDHRAGRVIPMSAEFRAQVERFEGRAFDPHAPIPSWTG